MMTREDYELENYYLEGNDQDSELKAEALEYMLKNYDVNLDEKINMGEPTLVWNGITHDYFLTRCEQATPDEANAMSFAAGMMLCGECTYRDFKAAKSALNAVESRLINEWEAANGSPLRNRFGQILGGEHPALNPRLYEEALANRKRQYSKD